MSFATSHRNYNRMIYESFEYTFKTRNNNKIMYKIRYLYGSRYI